jgi:hypothetical protein
MVGSATIRADTMKGAIDEPNADAISTFLFAVSDAMVTRSLSTLILSVVVFFLHLTRIRAIKNAPFHHLHGIPGPHRTAASHSAPGDHR